MSPRLFDISEYPSQRSNKPPSWSRNNGDRAHHGKEPTQWERHNFVCFDGEGCNIDGRHQYVYLAAYNGVQHYEVRNDSGLTTRQCLDFLCEVAGDNKGSINVIFSGSYDVNMMLGNLNLSHLQRLIDTNQVYWDKYWIRYIDRKQFIVKKRSDEKVIIGGCNLWDVFGFFQSKFTVAIQKWLGVDDSIINEGKKARGSFSISQLPEMIKYCKSELVYMHQLVNALWGAFDYLGIQLQRWDGAGAAAQALLSKKLRRSTMGTLEQQERHYTEARIAFKGGRFELFRPGDYQQTVYGHDINSAYPYCLSLVPAFTGLEECSDASCEIGEYDLLLIDYDWSETEEYNSLHVSGSVDIHPYGHRTSLGNVFFQPFTLGWQWGCEYRAAIQANRYAGSIRRHLHWRDNGVRPFSWIPEYFAMRQELEQKSNAGKAIKLALNSLYGKTVQQRGWKDRDGNARIPKFHQLYWGGWVTAKTRSLMYSLMMQAPEAVIAVETDGMYSTKPLTVTTGTGLGEYKVEQYSSMTYIQSGLYFYTDSEGKPGLKSRGIQDGALTRERVMGAYRKVLPRTVTVPSTPRFRTYRTSLPLDRFEEWRQWIVETKEIELYAFGKRVHMSNHCGCAETGAVWDTGHHHSTMSRFIEHERKDGTAVHPYESQPYDVLWITGGDRRKLIDAKEAELYEPFAFDY